MKRYIQAADNSVTLLVRYQRIETYANDAGFGCAEITRPTLAEAVAVLADNLDLPVSREDITDDSTAEKAIADIEYENGQGSFDYIISLENKTTGQTYIDVADGREEIEVW